MQHSHKVSEESSILSGCTGDYCLSVVSVQKVRGNLNIMPQDLNGFYCGLSTAVGLPLRNK